MSDTFVVVGGDAAGMSATSKARREDPALDVVVFETGEWVSYAACGMPYYVEGEVGALADLLAVAPEESRDERDIDRRTGHEIVGIDAEAEAVTVEGDGETFDRPYDHLLVATGATAIEPPFDGLGLDGVFPLHHVDEADAIENYVTERSPDSAAIVGGGHVGIEMAEALSAHGVDVHLHEMLPHVLRPFGDAVAETVEDHLREQGVQLCLLTAVSGFEGAERVGHVTLDDESHPAEVAIVGVGVEPNADLAADADIGLGETGALAAGTAVTGLRNADLAYAPPFSPVRDPILTAAKVPEVAGG